MLFFARFVCRRERLYKGIKKLVVNMRCILSIVPCALRDIFWKIIMSSGVEGVVCTILGAHPNKHTHTLAVR